MSSSLDEITRLRGYLLATMPEEERLELAARYFSDDELFERLKAAEADLIDEYVRGELSAEDRRLFEQTLETFPGRRDRVAFARALERLPAEGAEPAESAGTSLRGGGAGWLAAAAMFLLAVGSLWIAQRQRGELAQVRSELSRLQQQEGSLANENRDLRSRLEALERSTGGATRPLVGRVVSFILKAGQQREGPGSNRLEIPADAETVRLTLPIDRRDGARYQVRLEGPDGSELARREGSAVFPDPGGPGLTIELPAATLPRGDYVILVEEVSGATPEAVQEYAVRIVRP
jgi:hypothetical protein